MTRKSRKHCKQHTEPRDSFLDLIRSHQQCMLWSPPLEIEPEITECKAKTLPLSYGSTSHTGDDKLNSWTRIVFPYALNTVFGLKFPEGYYDTYLNVRVYQFK